MVVSLPAQDGTRNGPRPINLNKDFPQVLTLLESVFGEAVHQERRIFNQITWDQPSFLWRLIAAANRLAPGFVWEENGRIIGNVTLLPTDTAGRYLVANVAVHPDYRRQGIASLLMEEVINLVRERRGRMILLQVAKHNAAAVNLYKSLDFTIVGHMTSWYSSPSRLREIETSTRDSSNPPIRPLPQKRWREAYELDQLSLEPLLNWPEALSPDFYKRGLWQRVKDFVNGRRMETWSTLDPHNQLNGLGTIYSEWGRPHFLTMRTHPAWRGQLERPLLAKLIRRLDYLPHRRIRMDHPDDDETIAALLREANFYTKRTLTHMRLRL